MYVSDRCFFFNDTATTEIYTLSLHDALPISARMAAEDHGGQTLGKPVEVVGGDHQNKPDVGGALARRWVDTDRDRKSTRLNSSHANISYAVFCLKKK